MQMIIQTKFILFTEVMLQLLQPFAIGLKGLELTILTWKMKVVITGYNKIA